MVEFTNETYVQEILFTRERDAHKGDFGKVLIFAGSVGMAGAAVLCGRAALKSGAGLVQFLLPDPDSPLLPILQISVPEATCVFANMGQSDSGEGLDFFASLPDLNSYQSIACGSGLGRGETARRILAHILSVYEGSLLLDADALNMIAASEELAQMTRRCKAAVIITPHIGEARRLLHTNDSIRDPESRQAAVCALSSRYHCVAILKGAGTLVAGKLPFGSAAPEDSFRTDSPMDVFQNTTGNPGMATAGSGDCLAGLIASLLAQGYPPVDAARIGVYIHGKAGDLAANDLGEMGVISSDIISYIPLALKTSQNSPRSPFAMTEQKP